MKSFMSVTHNQTAPVKDASECNSCNGGVVRTTGQESNTPAVSTTTSSKDTTSTNVQPTEDQAKKAVVVMQGPLGTAITEALNKSLSKSNNGSPVQVPQVANEALGNESFALNHVQANGQINNPKLFISKISKAVGLVPVISDEATTINTLIDCASKVDDIEFLMVNKVEPAASQPIVPQKSIIQALPIEGQTALEEIAIESIQVVVTYSKRTRE